MHVSRRRFLAGSFILSTSGLVLAGCGGGGGGTKSISTTPTAATRAHVQSLHGQVARQLTSSGVSGTALAFTRNSYVGGGGGYGDAVGAPVPVASSGGGGAGAANTASGSANVPNLGGFLKNVAGVSPSHRAAHLAKSMGRDVVPGEEPTNPPVPDPVDYSNPSFYYDYYLELWVEVTNTPTATTYALFSDKAKTQGAGSIITTQPADYNIYPQVYDSSYSFTAGYLAGSHGTSKNTTNADYSFSGSYDNVYSDGWSDTGSSNGSATGDFSWQSRTETRDNKTRLSPAPKTSWTQGAGTFRSDGSGGTRFSTSEGYSADYVYNRDGSGQGHITGSDPGMPVTITWDAYGNTTIKYADGTVEQINAYTYYGGGTTGGNSGVIEGDAGSPSTEVAPSATPPSPPSPSPIGL